MRILTEKQVERVYNHFAMDYSNHKYICKSFKEVDDDMVMLFILKYIQPPLQHVKVIEDDVKAIALVIKKDGIKKPVF